MNDFWSKLLLKVAVIFVPLLIGHLNDWPLERSTFITVVVLVCVVIDLDWKVDIEKPWERK